MKTLDYNMIELYENGIVKSLRRGALTPAQLAHKLNVRQADPSFDAALDNLEGKGAIQRTSNTIWIPKKTKRRAWRSVKMLQEVNVSSSRNYHFSLYVSHHDRRIQAQWAYFDTALVVNNRTQQHMPKYLQRQVYEQALKLLRDGGARFFEYNRNGNKRYSDLRYHDPRMVDSMIAGLQERMEAL